MRVVYSVKCRNRARLLNALTRAKVAVSKIKNDASDNITLTIKLKDVPKTIEILDKMCYNYQVIAQYDMGYYWKMALSRVGIVIGLLVGIALTIAASARIWSIDVKGNDTIATATIVRTLRSVGVGVGSDNDVDLHLIRRTIDDMDGVAECVVGIRGTKLLIYIVESKKYQPPIYPTQAVIDSKYDATVTSIDVRSGTPMVKVGDHVAAGEVLIDGKVYSSIGELMYETAANGDVYGDVTFSRNVALNASSEHLVLTGKSCVVTTVGLFGLTIGKPSCDYEHYTLTVSSASINAYLPIKVTTYTYSELEWRQEDVDVQVAATELMKEFALEHIVEVGDAPYTLTHTAVERDGCIIVTVYLSARLKLNQRVYDIQDKDTHGYTSQDIGDA